MHPAEVFRNSATGRPSIHDGPPAQDSGNRDSVWRQRRVAPGGNRERQEEGIAFSSPVDQFALRLCIYAARPPFVPADTDTTLYENNLDTEPLNTTGSDKSYN